jgi:hypothetical protein
LLHWLRLCPAYSQFYFIFLSPFFFGFGFRARQPGQLLECVVTRQDPSSLLLADAVERDATIVTCTRCDPALVLLPRIEECCNLRPARLAQQGAEAAAGVFVTLDQILAQAYAPLRGVKLGLEKVCIVKDGTGSSTLRVSLPIHTIFVGTTGTIFF